MHRETSKTLWSGKARGIIVDQWMVDFVDNIVAPADERAAEKLSLALDGKGAFRHFRETLHRLDKQWLQAWYQWKEQHLKAADDAWLHELYQKP